MLEAIFDLIPEGGGAQALFDPLTDFCAIALAAYFQAVGDVVEDGAGEGVGFLEDHADLAAEGDGVEGGGVDVEAFDLNGALGDFGAGDAVIHAVKAAQESGFAATGGADQGGDGVAWDGHGDAIESLGLAIVEMQVADLNRDLIRGETGEGQGVGAAGRRGGHGGG